MNDTTTSTTTSTATEIHDLYVARINHLVGEDREALIPDLTADYEQQLRLAENERRAA